MITAGEISAQLAARALSVCRHYLPAGHRQGNYWVVGDVRNAPGRSMYVRLSADQAGHAPGRWTDAATGEFGDLLDIIRMATPSRAFVDALIEAEAFLGNLPTLRRPRFGAEMPRRSNRQRQAKTLCGNCIDLTGTIGERYLANRAIDPTVATGLRFHPNCYCRPGADECEISWPALIVPVTDTNANLTAVHRLYLDPRGSVDHRLGKAPIETPKRSLGLIHRNAARFGDPAPMTVVAEGVENALSIRTAFPVWTVHAALTASNLAAYVPLPATRHLLIALDDDEAGRWAAQTLTDRHRSAALSVDWLRPRNGDHNTDLRTFGLDVYRTFLLDQMAAHGRRPAHAVCSDRPEAQIIR